MKYCGNCGKELVDEAAICPGCGTAQPGMHNVQQASNSASNASLKGGLIGFLLTFFIGLIGFILCLCLGDEACKKASKITFIVSVIVYVVFVIIYIALIASMIGSGSYY